MTTYTAEEIEAIGGKRWTATDKKITRVYLDGDALATAIGLEVSRYSSGNVSGATLNGQRISNAEGKRLADTKIYLQDGDLYIQTTSRDEQLILQLVRDAIRRATPAADDPAEETTAAEPEADPAAERPTHTWALRYMLPIGKLATMQAERGPRWMVSATVRRGEHCAAYASSADEAEQLRAWLEERNYRNIRVDAPAGGVDLAALGRARRNAKAAADEATAVLRAGALQALAAGRDEAEVARTAGVDRGTVRAWAGKQPMNRG